METEDTKRLRDLAGLPQLNEYFHFGGPPEQTPPDPEALQQALTQAQQGLKALNSTYQINSGMFRKTELETLARAMQIVDQALKKNSSSQEFKRG